MPGGEAVLHGQTGGRGIPIEVAHRVVPVGGETRRRCRPPGTSRPVSTSSTARSVPGARYTMHVPGQHDDVERRPAHPRRSSSSGVSASRSAVMNGRARVAVGGDSHQAAVPVDPDHAVCPSGAVRRRSGRCRSRRPAPWRRRGASTSTNLASPSRSVPVGELPGEPVDVEVPPVTGDGQLPAGRRRVADAGHLRMMARRPRPDPPSAVDGLAEWTGAARDSDAPASGRRALRRRRMLSFLATHLVTGVEHVDGRHVLPVAATGRRNGHRLPDLADPG